MKVVIARVLYNNAKKWKARNHWSKNTCYTHVNIHALVQMYVKWQGILRLLCFRRHDGHSHLPPHAENLWIQTYKSAYILKLNILDIYKLNVNLKKNKYHMLKFKAVWWLICWPPGRLLKLKRCHICLQSFWQSIFHVSWSV